MTSIVTAESREIARYVYCLSAKAINAQKRVWFSGLSYLFLAEEQGSQRTSLFILLLPQNLAGLCIQARFYLFFSRKGAKVAKNFNFYFVLIRNTFAYFAPWREQVSVAFPGGRDQAFTINSYG